MSKYPKTIIYEDLDGTKKSIVVKNEFEQRVLENTIEKQMQLKSELDVASDVFSYEMDLLKRRMRISKEEQSQENTKKLKHKLEVRRKEIEVGRKELEKKKAIRKAKIEQIKEASVEKRKKVSLSQKIVRFTIFVLVLFVIFFILFYFYV